MAAIQEKAILASITRLSLPLCLFFRRCLKTTVIDLGLGQSHQQRLWAVSLTVMLYKFAIARKITNNLNQCNMAYMQHTLHS